MIFKKDKKKLTEIRELMEKYKILAIYAEQVVEGKMNIEEAREKSYRGIKTKKEQ